MGLGRVVTPPGTLMSILTFLKGLINFLGIIFGLFLMSEQLDIWLLSASYTLLEVTKEGS